MIALALAGFGLAGCALTGQYDFGPYRGEPDAAGARAGSADADAGRIEVTANGAPLGEGGAASASPGEVGSGGVGAGALPVSGNDPDSLCRALSCEKAGAQCGTLPDGCGGRLDCGTCEAPNRCGGGGVPNRCGCTPRSCAELGAECGTLDDGCGNTLSCGSCGGLRYCGILAPNRCDLAPCLPATCRQLDAQCGIVEDGCGGALDCGACKRDEVCGAKEPNRCGEDDD